jgi:phytoene desaturase
MTSPPQAKSTDAIVIGAGFSGIAAATTIASLGKQVDVLERHDHPGGRARVFEDSGFTFDMGPSWYWMPDVFEAYFKKFGSDVEQELNLVRLDPSYKVWFAEESLEVPASFQAMQSAFDAIESGAGGRLKAFMEEAKTKYDIGMSQFVWKPAHNALEFVDWDIAKQATQLSLLTSFSKHARKYFTDPRLLQIMEFPVLFLGGKPEKTPALYSLMNYADTMLGTWYPMGGMHEVVLAMVRVAEKIGVRFHYNQDVNSILTEGGKAAGVSMKDGVAWHAKTIVAGADYHHVEQHLLPEVYRRYDKKYWDSRTMSPSSLLFYVGLDCEVPDLRHHNLFFDTPFGPHAETIYDSKTWPTDPLFYISAPSKTDPNAAPKGGENLFFLIPLAPGLTESPGQREEYFNHLCDRLHKHVGLDIRPHIVFKRSFAHAEFEEDYSAYKGNAYGLANTLRQTAFWKPKMRSKLPGLFFTGQLTTPGPGVPPSLISGEVAGKEALAWMNQNGL